MLCPPKGRGQETSSTSHTWVGFHLKGGQGAPDDGQAVESTLRHAIQEKSGMPTHRMHPKKQSSKPVHNEVQVMDGSKRARKRSLRWDRDAAAYDEALR
jgi:hypothetical protein